MTQRRREFLRGLASGAAATASFALFPPAIQRALAIPARRQSGSLEDVGHIVVLMQENRSFDHYFGTLHGVRGFGDRFPIPVPNSAGVTGKNVWYQSNPAAQSGARVIAPFRLNTEQAFDYMRVTGTPHSWPDAQLAWADGRLHQWPRFKENHSLGYFTQADIPFQFALANAFTLCDAYHCSFQGGTNPNRLFLWTGTNDPLQRGHGPALTNDYDNLDNDPDGGYTWTTYTERLQRAGVRWQVYQDMDDNFTDNPLAGFRSYRDAYHELPGALLALKERGLSTRDLDLLAQDVANDALPQVSFIVATAEGSEHPGPSSPAQGAEYTARVLDALTSNPNVWSKTVLLVMFDENDGFFDHVPPPAAASYVRWDADPRRAQLAGDSTVDTTGEYHSSAAPDDDAAALALLHKPYGLGPRVPMYVVSPWSKGGYVDSQVFDHTSVIRFIEQRFGVREPNISAWRRAVAGDLTSAFNFRDPDNTEFYASLPDTTELAERARALPDTTTPPTPDQPVLPEQALGTRPSRALPYELHVHAECAGDRVELQFVNTGRAGAVFHVYDRLHLDSPPRRYTVEAGKQLRGTWLTRTGYDLWVLGPNGFHRHFAAAKAGPDNGVRPEIEVRYDPSRGNVAVSVSNSGSHSCGFVLRANAYFDTAPLTLEVPARSQASHYFSLRGSGQWYDFSVSVRELPGFLRRFAGRVETGRDTISDPALGGPAHGEQLRIG